jgi:hypothetical protein
MPTYARRQIVVEDMVGVYHCVARCVRRAFLCGVDPYTGKDYSHRKEWILDRMRELAGLFAIEVCGYSVVKLRRTPFLINGRGGTSTGFGVRSGAQFRAVWFGRKSV